MEVEEKLGPPRGMLLGIGLIGILVAGGLAAEFIFRLQPALPGSVAAPGTVLMPEGVGSNTGLTFSPSTITVILGVNSTVTWINKDSVVHTVTATDKSFNSGNVEPGQTFTYNFTEPGTYTYYCEYHSWMRGTVVVESPSGAGGVTVDIPAGASANTLNYSPSSITLVAGVNNTVTFVNQDSSVHSVTSDNGTFDSGPIQAGASWTYTFPVGTYSYHCIYHSWMKGNITVIAG